MTAQTAGWLASLVLVAHLAVVAFVILGLVAIPLGNALGWDWVNAPAWRWVHLATMAFVAVEAWLGIACPLTVLEQWLQQHAGVVIASEEHPAGWIATWVSVQISRWLYWDLPAWVFVGGYSLFALAIVAALLRYPPRRRRSRTLESPRLPGRGRR